MRKRSSKRYSRDVNAMASRIVQSIADLDVGKKNPAAVALGRLGGKRGGPAIAENSHRKSAARSPRMRLALGGGARINHGKPPMPSKLTGVNQLNPGKARSTYS